MALNAVRARPGPVAARWLVGKVREIQTGYPLRPVTVAVPNHYVGLALRREFADVGYANVRFTQLAGLAESFGAPVLAARGLSPLTDIDDEAAIRESLRRSGDEFGEVRQHRGVVEMLKVLFRELRERGISDEQLTDWSHASRVASAAFATFASYRELLGQRGLYDETDLLAAAAAGLAGPTRRRLREVGHTVVFLPQHWRPATSTFLLELSGQSPVEVAFPELEDELADAQARRASASLGLDWSALDEAGGAGAEPVLKVVLAPDPAGEVRAAVRQIAADLEAGVPLYRMAILYRREEPYAALVRETLAAAGLPWAALGGRPLADSTVGRGLLGLLRLRDQDFARRAVLDWRSTLPHAGPDKPTFSEWNRISREAGVVRGLVGWQRGLRRLVNAIDQRLKAKEAGLSEGQVRRLERERKQANRIADEIERIAADTEPPSDTSWGSLVDWAARCRKTHVPNPGSESEREAGEAVDEVVQKLRIAGTIEERTGIGTFIDTLDAALRAKRRAEGRLGAGVSIGSPGTAVGMAFHRVHLLGLSEGVYPAPEPANPIFPDGDRLDRRQERLGDERRSFLAALAATDDGQVRLSAPSWDTSLRVTFAAPWLLETSSKLEGRPLTSSELRELSGRTWLTRILSPSQSIDTAPAWLDVGEWHIAEARRSQGRRTLERSGLARRTDLSLGRNLEVLRSRESTLLTSFDGHVRRRHDAGLGHGSISASGIQEWATCPFRYFMRRVLHVASTEDPEDDEQLSMSPLLRGALVHRILEDFFSALQKEGRPKVGESYTAADHESLESLARLRFGEVEEEGRAGHVLSWRNDREGLLLDLHATLTSDEHLRGSLTPAKFEQPFGMGADSWPPAAVALTGGGEAQLKGYIDRVDLPPGDPNPERALVLDYKSGGLVKKKDLAEDPVVAGTQIQLAAYSLATYRWLVDHMGAQEPTVRAEYWGVSANEKFDRVGVTLDPVLRKRLSDVLNIIDEALRTGSFPQVPGEETQRGTRGTWDNCSYCPYNRVCPSGRDQLCARKRNDAPSALHGALALDGEQAG